jgi:aspartate/methionine/tyrosine aminotransferase
VVEVARKVHDFLTVGAPAPLMQAALVGLGFGQDYYDALLATYTKKRNLFLGGLTALGISHTKPEGAYYIMLDIGEYGYASDLDFCYKLARDVGIGAVPGSSFFREPENRYIRLHFAKKEETLLEALNRLENLKTVMRKSK